MDAYVIHNYESDFFNLAASKIHNAWQKRELEFLFLPEAIVLWIYLEPRDYVLTPQKKFFLNSSFRNTKKIKNPE